MGRPSESSPTPARRLARSALDCRRGTSPGNPRVVSSSRQVCDLESVAASARARRAGPTSKKAGVVGVGCSLAPRRTDILRKCKVRRPQAASGAHDAARLQRKYQSAGSSAFNGRQASDLLVASPPSPSQMGRSRAALRKGTQREGPSLGLKREDVKRYAGYSPPAWTTGARQSREARMARELLLPFKREQRVT